ncbi:hypothetical protein Pcinc_037955, partial [Petrolisthes cinctipes]
RSQKAVLGSLQSHFNVEEVTEGRPAKCSS